ncbi:MAG: S8 family serine peptidase [Ignavibacteriales bacterium]|nr:S8 family serine peptidase [Ignavibacteriales bacterium]
MTTSVSAHRVSSVLFCLCWAASFSFGQSSEYKFFEKNSVQRQASSNRHQIRRKPGQVGRVAILRDGTTKTHLVDLTDQVRLIVEFKEEPLFLQQARNSSAVLHKSSVQQRFSQFSSDIASIVHSASAQLKTALAEPVVTRRYYKIFYGVALNAPRAAISEIRNLSYVKAVHDDEKVQAHLDRSVHLIRADSVRAKYGTQGEDVIVGIIDTGIDYFHPSLGGSAFPNSKVIGGYDLENNDPDPFDDNGHGTHVAGIVAADGDSIKGVAPKAKLMAFKVLGAYGSGQFSTVLAGIERAVDPNNDDDYADRVHIANMSLGGSGHPDDPLSAAVDNAVRLGVTFCISAGNSGRFRSIGSPGTARLAITVGASNDLDKLAGFSSRGPTTRTYAIKPDVVAPGVNILSTVPGGFDSYSGTSMSSPHVAGVCALLKAIHPTWLPGYMKSALVTSAVDLGEEVMAQGGGRIDAVRAAEIGSFAIPSGLHFGLDDANMNPWTRNDTLWVHNNQTLSQSYSLSTGPLLSGVSLSLSPQSFSVDSGSAQPVVVSLSVDNSIVPFPDSGSLAYSGVLNISGSTDTMHVPWAFVKAAKLILTFNEPSFFAVAGKKFVAYSFEADSISSMYAELVVPRGSFDIMSEFFDGSKMRIVLREQVQINSFTSLSISSTEAQYYVAPRGRDDQGTPLSSFSISEKIHCVAFPDSSLLNSWIFLGFRDTFYLSSISERFAFLVGEYASDGLGKNIVVQHQPVQNLQQSVTLLNSVDSFRRQSVGIEFPPSAQTRGVGVVFLQKILQNDDAFYLGFAPLNPTPVGKSWVSGLLITPDVHPNFGFTALVEAYDELFEVFPFGTVGRFYLNTPPFAVVRDSVAAFWGRNLPTHTFLSPPGGIHRFGNPPVYTDAFHINNYYGVSNVAAFPYFYGPLDENKSVLMAGFTLYDSQDNVIAKDTLLNSVPVDVPPGEYRLRVSYAGYHVNDVRGSATLTTRFDLRRPDPNPPGLSSMKILNSQQKPFASLQKDENATLLFSSNDLKLEVDDFSASFKYQPVADSTKVSYRLHGTDTWTSLGLTLLSEDSTSLLTPGKLYRADLSATTSFDSAAIDLLFQIQDESGNSTEWVLDPAFGVGNFGNPSSVKETQKTTIIPTEFTLFQNFPNPFNPLTRIVYDLPQRAKVSLFVYNVLGQVMTSLADEEKDAGRYEITWDGKASDGQPLSTGVYFYRLHAGTFVATKKLLLMK